MALVSGDERARYLAVLSDWRFGNIVIWHKDALQKLDEFLSGHSPLHVSELLHEHVANGGAIHRKVEDRDPWQSVWKFHYDIILPIAGQDIYVETRLDERRHDWPKIHIVHLHPPGRHFDY